MTRSPLDVLDNRATIPLLDPSNTDLSAQIVSRKEGEELYLVSDLVQAGDVLLTCGTEKFSKLIAQMTGGPFSHAAVAASPLTLYEALDDGIGATPLESARIEEHDNNPIFLVHLPNADSAVLLRHPSFSELKVSQTSQLQILIQEIVYPYLGMHYPTLHKLAPALPEGNPLRIFHSTFREQIAKAFPPKELEGPFCSALVSLIFHELKMPLFEGASADSVSPSSLFTSGLHLVPGAVRRADVTQDGMPELTSSWNESTPQIAREQQIAGDRARLEAIKTVEAFSAELDAFAIKRQKLFEDFAKAIRVLRTVADERSS